ncbi:MAG TPA: L-histidine N(alpha)-methyltransferase [Acidimicrobiales bacterium]
MTPHATFDVHLADDAYRSALLADVEQGLSGEPKELAPKWFYDEVGSALFEQITGLPEYYPTRCEREIIAREADSIVSTSGADSVVELGSGTSEKSRLLLAAFERAGSLERFIPVDVSEATLRSAAIAINREFPECAVHGVVGDFEHHLHLLPREGRRMVAFLGGTVGNFFPAERKAFFAELAAGLDVGDTFLLGTDLIKDAGRLVAAYDDAAGVTADFNRNVLAVINRELDATFDLARFHHVARWDATEHRIEMHLRSDGHQIVRVGALDLDVGFADGEHLRTEISTKFTRELLDPELADAGFSPEHWWTDAAGDYALSLWRLR